MIIQTITSANTSINSSKLPAIYNKIDWFRFKMEMKRNGVEVPTILDFGCGKYTAHIRDTVFSYGCNWAGYDPYNGFKWVDNYWDLLNEPIDLIICSNVFNVIKEREVIAGIHAFFRKKRELYNTSYLIKVYEGDGSCVGRETKKDCWQRNEPTGNYMYCDEVMYKGIILKYEDKWLLD